MFKTIKNWFHLMGSPRSFDRIAGKITPWLIAIFALLTLTGLYLGLVVAPTDYQQGESYRIIYIHVPTAWMSMLIYVLMAIAATVGLIWRIKVADAIASASAPIGAAFTFIALVTGSLWGKPMWGTWWVWDARLTSMLILFIFYIAYISVWKFVDNYEKANRVSSIIAIIGSLNLPVIKYSVDWWNTLHQSSSITLTSAPTIHYTMLIPLIIMLIGTILYTLIVFLMRYKTEIMKFKLDKRNKEN